jgi:hypothetical protein
MEYGAVPHLARLYPNYPNPFNASTTVIYVLAERATVQLNVYNILGRRVREVFTEIQRPGRYQIQLNAEDHASGVYLLELRIGRLTLRQRMILIK